ncbi:MAG: glycosyltransferase, partial [Rhodospirillales bacterium]|nr:glycosyltransferase [Rhodospirillales bacterium]
ARANRNVTRVIVGNEVMVRRELELPELISYVDRARQALAKRRIPVSAAETWDIWLANPELGRHVDYVAAHILPYWEGVHLDHALDHVKARYADLKMAFPKLPIVIAEAGWPSTGRARKEAVATRANEGIFLRRFLAAANEARWDYSLMEAFDQPWKVGTEGAVGAYWGIWDAERNAKFSFTKPLRHLPQWPALAVATAAIAFASLGLLLRDGTLLKNRGRSFLTVVAHLVAAGGVWIGFQYFNQYLTPLSISVGVVLFVGFLGLAVVLLTEAHEMAEAAWVKMRRRPFAPAAAPAGAPLPKVSIHVPAYNEPPEMMIDTLNALARLDYPDFEVLVIDNNTRDEAVWRPVEAHCARLGGRFRFFHVCPLAGYKAGALNYTLERTAPDAEVVAVIDSDYIVSPDWLRDLVPHFHRPEIAIVQAPQDYRDEHENVFKAMCYAEYRGFFHIGMVTRNDRNAIIQHGTMTMIRTHVLREVGGWAEWCITEDAELGLKILERGWEEAYVEKSYGRGLMPDTFIDFKKQRSRWAFGAIQILRSHAREVFSLTRSRLTFGQRYHFLAGWLPWIADGLNLGFTLGAVLWSMGMLVLPRTFEAPLAACAIPPFALFAFKLIKLLVLYRSRVHIPFSLSVGAAVAGLALSHTVAKAVISGFITKERPFFRTPKCENKPLFVQALLAVQEEAALLVVLVGMAVAVWLADGGWTFEVQVWSAMLVMMALPHMAAVAMSALNVLPARRPSLPMVLPQAGKPAGDAASAG